MYKLSWTDNNGVSEHTYETWDIVELVKYLSFLRKNNIINYKLIEYGIETEEHVQFRDYTTSKVATNGLSFQLIYNRDVDSTECKVWIFENKNPIKLTIKYLYTLGIPVTSIVPYIQYGTRQYIFLTESELINTLKLLFWSIINNSLSDNTLEF